MGATRVIIKSRLPKVAAIVNAKADLITAKAAHDVEARAKARAPVDTGALRASINTRRLGHASYQVDSPADYSVFQEFGTRYQAAQPYMLPALEEVRPSYLAALRKLP